MTVKKPTDDDAVALTSADVFSTAFGMNNAMLGQTMASTISAPAASAAAAPAASGSTVALAAGPNDGPTIPLTFATNPLSPTLVEELKLPADSYTNVNTRLRVTGALDKPLRPGDTAQIKLDDGSDWLDLSVPVGSSNWSYVDLRTLSDGVHKYTVQVLDAAGNIGSTDEVTIGVDTKGPTNKAEITGISEDSGTANNDFITNDNDGLTIKASLTTTLDQAERLLYSRDSGLTWADISDAVKGQAVSFFDEKLTSTATIRMRVIDMAGNVGSSDNQKITIDVEAPPGVVEFTGYTDDVAPLTGDFKSGSTTNDTSPLLKGTVQNLGAGETVKIYEGTTLVGDAKVSGSNWSLQLTGVTEAAHTYTAKIVDVAGNPGKSIDTLTLTVDNTPPPGEVKFTGYTDDVAPLTGDFKSGSTTNDTSPLLKGTVQNLGAGETIKIYEGATLVGDAKVNGSDWSLQLTGVTEAAHTYTAKIVDASGNDGKNIDTLTLTVDTTPPTGTVEITAYTDDVTPVIGDFKSGTTTNDASPLLKGTVQNLGVGETVKVYEGNTLIGDATVNGSNWTLQLNGLSKNVDHTYTAKIVDLAGLDKKSNDFTLKVDDQPPLGKAEITFYADDVAPATGDFKSGTKTNDDSPMLKGTVDSKFEAGDMVKVYEGTTLLGDAVVSGSNWTFQLKSLTPNVTHTYTAKVMDAAGNEGDLSAPFTLTVDNVAPPQTVDIVSIADDNGKLNNDFITNDPTLKFSGTVNATLAADEKVQVSLDDGKTWNDAITVGQNWSWDPPDADPYILPAGDYTITARVVDEAGNAGKIDTQALKIDLTKPSAIAEITAVAVDTGTPGDFITSVQVLSVTTKAIGTIGPDEYVEVSQDNGKSWRAAVDQGGGIWTVPTQGSLTLTEGKHIFQTRVTDTAGNRSDLSSKVVTIDLTTPPATTTIVSYTDDVGDKQGNFGTNTTTDDKNIVLNGTVTKDTLAANDVIAVYNDNKFIGYADINRTAGTWSYAANDLADKSHYVYTTKVIDVAGNTSLVPSNAFDVYTNQSGIDTKIFIESVGGSKWWHDTGADGTSVGTVNNDFIGITSTDFTEVDGMVGAGFNSLVFEASNMTLNVSEKVIPEMFVLDLKRIQQFDLNNQLNTKDTGPDPSTGANPYQGLTTGNKLVLTFDDVENLVGQYKNEDANKDGKPDIFSTNQVVSGTTSATHLTILGDASSTVQLDAGWSKTAGTNTMNIYNGLGDDEFTYTGKVFDVWHHTGSDALYDLLIMQGVVVNVT
ncbi:MAG: Ig-like domain-containing protein [Burkholderiaceae bacterium]|nr:Ig-like domain-containing protein [Burkholderiaceae bacterium]